ncbi:MAG: Uracil-xanthine permease [Candidatus Tokpelaia sp. JSC085]|nr:MAG: Uracil-xanthine permease [Candidatus Tokpelaia sp. JSC085]
MKNDVSPADEMPPLGKVVILGIQHVIVMYAGTITIPLILGNAIGLNLRDVVLLLNANLLISGVATLFQTLGFWRFGARIPLIQGCSFIALTPMIMIGQQYGIEYIFGSVIVSGILTIFVAPIFSRFLHFFPPVVTGSLITIIGISLMPAAARWLGGGNPEAADFGSLSHLGLGLATIIITLIFYARFTGFIANSSILISLSGGTLIAAITGYTDFSMVSAAPWFDFVKPFAFGLPKLSVIPIILIFIAMIVIMVETIGTSLAVGELVDRKITPEILANTLRSNGLSTMLGGVFNSFPYNAFMQNTGLIAMTGVKSRYVMAFSGVVLILLGLFPKLAAIVATLPAPVLGGAAVIMFGMTAVTGIQQLSRVRYEGTHNAIIVAIALGLGMLPMSFPALFSGIKGPFKVIVESGAFMGALTVVTLNAMLNGVKKRRK